MLMQRLFSQPSVLYLVEPFGFALKVSVWRNKRANISLVSIN